MKKDELIPRPEEVKTPLAELRVMANGANSTFFQVQKRWARRYAEQLKNKSFRLSAGDPKFATKHTEYLHQAVGMELLIRLIEGASKKIDETEEAE